MRACVDATGRGLLKSCGRGATTTRGVIVIDIQFTNFGGRRGRFSSPPSLYPCPHSSRRNVLRVRERLENGRSSLSRIRPICTRVAWSREIAIGCIANRFARTKNDESGRTGRIGGRRASETRNTNCNATIFAESRRTLVAIYRPRWFLRRETVVPSTAKCDSSALSQRLLRVYIYITRHLIFGIYLFFSERKDSFSSPRDRAYFFRGDAKISVDKIREVIDNYALSFQREIASASAVRARREAHKVTRGGKARIFA